MYIDEPGTTCADNTPVKYWEYPVTVFAADTCTHKIGFSSKEAIVGACKAHDGQAAC